MPPLPHRTENGSVRLDVIAAQGLCSASQSDPSAAVTILGVVSVAGEGPAVVLLGIGVGALAGVAFVHWLFQQPVRDPCAAPVLHGGVGVLRGVVTDSRSRPLRASTQRTISYDRLDPQSVTLGRTRLPRVNANSFFVLMTSVCGVAAIAFLISWLARHRPRTGRPLNG